MIWLYSVEQLGLRAGEIVDPNSQIPPTNVFAVEAALDRFDNLRHAKGSVPTSDLRLEMQKTMQRDAAVFRASETMSQGLNEMVDLAERYLI